MTGKQHSVRPSVPAADFSSNGQGSGMGGNHGNALIDSGHKQLRLWNEHGESGDAANG